MNYAGLLLAVLFAAYIGWRTNLSRTEERREQDQQAHYRRCIADDPRNLGAYEGLGDSLRRSGRLFEARDTYLEALERGSDQIVADRTQYKLTQLDRDIRQQAEDKSAGPFGIRRRKIQREFYFCPNCGEPNPPHFKDCERCGVLLPADSYWDALTENWRHPATRRAAQETIAIIVVVIALLRVLYFLPLDVQGMLILSSIIVICWRFLQAVEGRRG